MDNLIKNVAIDWRWVGSHVSSGERIKDMAEGSAKEAVLEQLEKAVSIAKLAAKPAISMVKKEITNFGPLSFELEGGINLSSKELSSHLKGASSIYAFLVTIGNELEDTASSYMNSGDHLLGYLLDRIGSFAAESLAENTEKALRNYFAPWHLSVSMRFSPGYCDWPIEEQFKLAGIIDFPKAGVTLTKSCMMIPKKSISAIVGIGPEKLFSKVASPCALCNMKVCDYRRRS
ncbi:MAG: vitamin B12 dependent-methionine synthase activation domain-containing protein [Candidatus Omnitrophica bacterium]|nr:vitamin B12 dependent-methionine synthase activation domain-containing protein [Candidatus Omnitrophota bacterium]